MSQIQKKLFLAFTLIITSLMINCGEPTPIKEMSLAKFEISRALSVKADKYATEEINEAKKNLLQCHDQIKIDKLKKAKETAIESHQKAIEAYNKSIPLLARDTLDIAEKSLIDAEEAFAEVLAKEEFDEAKNTLQKSNELFENKEYYNSYHASLKADEYAKNALNISLGKKDLLQDAINEVKAIMEEANKYNSEKYATDKIPVISENISIAENSLESLKLKDGFTAIEIAKVNADEAFLESLKETTQENVSNAEILLEQAQNSEGAEIAKTEMDAAKESLELAQDLFSESKYKESLSSCEESTRFSYIVINTKPEPEPEPEPEIVAVIEENNDDVPPEPPIEEVPKVEVIEEKTTELPVEKPVEKKEKLFHIYRVKYIPQRRDCLWRIAKRYYNNPWLWEKIYLANKDKITDPDLIWPDMRLKIPIIKKNKKE